MSVRRALLAGLVLLAATSAVAGEKLAFWQSRDSNYNNATVAPSGFQGIGDVVAGLTACWSLRACIGSYATSGTNKAVNLRRASDSATCDFAIATSGGLGGTLAACAQGTGLSPTAFATTHATCTGTIASTTLTCTGASATPQAGDTLTGTGIVQPSYVVSCGTFTGGAGTCTLNSTQTVSVGETITMTYGLNVVTLYDQSGANACASAACNVTQATTADQPNFLPTCLDGFPCVYAETNVQFLQAAGNLTPATGKVSFSSVGFVSSNLASSFLRENGASGNRLTSTVTLGTWQIVGGTSGTFTFTGATNAAWNAANVVMNGASSTSNVNGTTGSGTATGSTAAGTPFVLVGVSGAILGFQEGGVYDNVAFTSGQATSLCHNQFSYWGTSTSC